MSALEKQRIMKAIDTGIKVFKNRETRITTSVLNKWLEEVLAKQPPPSHRGNFIKIKYVTQLPTKVPSFAFFCNHPNDVKQPYRNYIENQLRAAYNFRGVPINIFFRSK